MKQATQTVDLGRWRAADAWETRVSVLVEAKTPGFLDVSVLVEGKVAPLMSGRLRGLWSELAGYHLSRIEKTLRARGYAPVKPEGQA